MGSVTEALSGVSEVTSLPTIPRYSGVGKGLKDKLRLEKLDASRSAADPAGDDPVGAHLGDLYDRAVEGTPKLRAGHAEFYTVLKITHDDIERRRDALHVACCICSVMIFTRVSSSSERESDASSEPSRHERTTRSMALARASISYARGGRFRSESM